MNYLLPITDCGFLHFAPQQPELGTCGIFLNTANAQITRLPEYQIRNTAL